MKTRRAVLILAAVVIFGINDGPDPLGYGAASVSNRAPLAATIAAQAMTYGGRLAGGTTTS